MYESDEEDEQSQPGKEVRGSKEPLFDFLERQTRNQIKFALGNVRNSLIGENGACVKTAG